MSRTSSYAPRTISLLCELFHPPVQPDPAPVQRVHDQLFRAGASPYSSFAVTPGGAVLSNPVPVMGANSFAAFRADRFQFCEELSSVTYEDFATRVRAVSRDVAALRGLAGFNGQQVTLRTLVNPRAYKDSREYLKHAMFGFDDEMEAFGREPALLGIRLVFPGTPENVASHILRIESFNNDPRSLFLEIVSSYGPIPTEGGLVKVEENIHASYRFLTQETLRFVAGFDTSGPSSVGGDEDEPA